VRLTAGSERGSFDLWEHAHESLHRIVATWGMLSPQIKEPRSEPALRRTAFLLGNYQFFRHWTCTLRVRSSTESPSRSPKVAQPEMSGTS